MEKHGSAILRRDGMDRIKRMKEQKIMGMRTSLCRGCGAEIGFIKTVAGKTMPVNAKSVRFAAGGAEVFVLPDGNVVHGTRLEEGQSDPTESIGYVSHFATCPAADSFRRQRKSDRKKS